MVGTINITKELDDRCKAAEKDAERYRWLRHGDNDEPLLKFSLDARCGTDDVWLLRNEELDAAIDAEMQKTPNDKAQGAGGGLIAGGSPGATG